MLTPFSSFVTRPGKMKFFGEDSDEVIMLVLRRHVITNLRWVFLSLFFYSIPFLLMVLDSTTGLNPFEGVPSQILIVLTMFWYLFCFGFTFEKYLLWFFNVHIITTKRLVDMDFHGLLFRNFSDAPLRNVEDVTHTINGAGQVIFNFGNVLIQTAGEKREIDFLDIPKPAVVQDYISDMVAELEVGPYDNN